MRRKWVIASTEGFKSSSPNIGPLTLCPDTSVASQLAHCLTFSHLTSVIHQGSPQGRISLRHRAVSLNFLFWIRFCELGSHRCSCWPLHTVHPTSPGTDLGLDPSTSLRGFSFLKVFTLVESHTLFSLIQPLQTFCNLPLVITILGSQDSKFP